MRGRRRRSLLLFMLVTLLASLRCTCLWWLPLPDGDPMCREAPYSPPPETFQESDLVGTWKTSYWTGSVDSLTFHRDGTFKQVFTDSPRGNYRYQIRGAYRHETPWNDWSLELLPDGGVRVHLEGARYYPDGIKTAERDGWQSWGDPDPSPMPFFDPIAEELVEMLGELVLQVRVDSSGRLLLHHMWTYHDRGFVVSGCESEQFRRVETP
jgi:hypothetical protein